MSAVILAVLMFSLGLVVFKTQHTPWVEMITYPYLLNHGFALYKDLAAPYTPLLVWFLQGAEGLFGYTPQFSQRLTLVLAVTNVLLIFYLSKKLWKKNSASLFSAGLYVFWFQYFEGNGLWFELVQTPLILLSFFFFYRWFFQTKFRQDLLWGSIFLATAFFIKQSVLWIVLAVLLWGIRGRKLLIFAVPFAVLFAATSSIAFIGGYLKDYWWWAYYYTFIQFPFTPGHNLYPTLAQLLKLTIPLAVLLPLLTQVFKKKEAVFCLLFLGSAGMAILPRWSLFHLQPFLALTAVISAPFLWGWLFDKSVWKKVALFLVLGVWVTVAVRQIGRFEGLEYRFWDQGMRMAATQTLDLGQSVYVFNGPDQLYVLNRITPLVKPYVQNFAWQMEMPGVQERLIESLKASQPAFVLYSPSSGRGGFEIGDYRPKLLGDFIEANYTLREKISGDIWILERNKR